MGRGKGGRGDGETKERGKEGREEGKRKGERGSGGEEVGRMKFSDRWRGEGWGEEWRKVG